MRFSSPPPLGRHLFVKEEDEMNHRKTWSKALIVACITALFLAGAATAHAASTGQTVYVPVYSHIYSGNMGKPFDLAVTLSIRNTDPHSPITVTRVDYYDSEGKLLTRHLDKPIVLAPLAATRFILKESDRAGGSGANFIVAWKAAGPVTPALIESIMISTRAQQGISFASRGQVIREK